MSYTCKGKDGNTYNLQLLYIQRAYLPAITVCNQSLFKQTFVPNPPLPLPSVTNFVLESNGLVASFNWTPNATYTTYSEYKIDSGEWIPLDNYAANIDHSFFNFIGIATIGQSIYIRLRFGNGTNYGAWNEEYTVTNPFILFYGNTLPDLTDFTDGITYSSEPTLSLSGNNVIIDHPEYVTGFSGYIGLLSPYAGIFDFTACSNVASIEIAAFSNVNVDVSNCGNLTSFTISKNNSGEFDIDFTGCTSLIYISLVECNIANINFMSMLPNKSLLQILDLSQNDITTADLTDFTNLYALRITSNNLSSLLVNSANLQEIIALATALTSLDISCSSTYNIISIGSPNFSTLTIADGTTNDGTIKSSYQFGDNLSAASLDALFTALGEAVPTETFTPPTIYVQNNPGAELCDPTIATEKGWGVYTGF